MTEDIETPIDDPIATGILDALADGSSQTVETLARNIAEQRRRPKDGPELWRKYMLAVKQQALHLAKQKRIELVHRGSVIEANDFKGRVYLRLPH